MSANPLLVGVTTAVPTYGTTLTIPDNLAGPFTVQTSMAGTGTVTATVVFSVSNTQTSTDWLTLATVSLSGTTTAQDGYAFSSRWKYIRAGVTAISGTGAAVNATLNV